MLELPKRKSRYNPQELSAAHREVIRLETLGVKVNDISEQLGISRHAVRYILASPLAMQMRQELQERRDDKVVDVTARLAQMCPKALDVLDDTIQGEFDDVPNTFRARTALEILDRCGFGKVVRTQNTNLNTSLTAEDILALRERARAAAAASGVLACQTG